MQNPLALTAIRRGFGITCVDLGRIECEQPDRSDGSNIAAKVYDQTL